MGRSRRGLVAAAGLQPSLGRKPRSSGALWTAVSPGKIRRYRNDRLQLGQLRPQRHDAADSQKERRGLLRLLAPVRFGKSIRGRPVSLDVAGRQQRDSLSRRQRGRRQLCAEPERLHDRDASGALRPRARRRHRLRRHQPRRRADEEGAARNPRDAVRPHGRRDSLWFHHRLLLRAER